MGSGGWGLVGVFALVIWLGVQNNIEERDKKVALEKLEASRVSTSDPLKNLAGCMVNHSTLLAKIQMAAVIHATDKKVNLGKEQFESYEKTRNMLVEECSKEHFPKISTSGRQVSFSELNIEFLAVMRGDPEVQAHMDVISSAEMAVKSAYVK